MLDALADDTPQENAPLTGRALIQAGAREARGAREVRGARGARGAREVQEVQEARK